MAFANLSAQFTWVRIRPGAEDKVNEFLTKHAIPHRFAFGYYDILFAEEHRPGQLDPQVHMLPSEWVEETVPLVLLPLGSNGKIEQQENLVSWFSAPRVTLCTVAKVSSDVSLAFGSRLEHEFAGLVKPALKQSEDSWGRLDLFFSLGHSEFVLFLSGDDENKLLDALARLRSSKVQIGDGVAKRILLNTQTTITLKDDVFHLSSLEAAAASSKSEASLFALEFISAFPDLDNAMLAGLDEQQFPKERRFTFFGRDDSVALTDKPQGLEALAFSILELRRTLPPLLGVSEGDAGTASQAPIGVRNATFAIRPQSQDSSCQTDSLTEPPPAVEASQGLAVVLRLDDLARRLSVAQKAGSTEWTIDQIRLSLAMFNARLRAGLSSLASYDSFLDMIGVAREVEARLEEILNRPGSISAAHPIELGEIENLLAKANEGLDNRYPLLEAHIASTPYPPSGWTLGTNKAIMAMGSVPRHSLDAIARAGVPEASWQGFLAMGAGRSFHHYPGGIITVPTQTLSRPIETWTIIAHEIGHYLYGVLDAKSDFEGSRRRVTYNLQLDIGESDVELWGGRAASLWISKHHLDVVAEELFCYWYQFRFVYNSDPVFFTKSVWSLLIDFPDAWNGPSRFLHRTFPIFVLDRFHEDSGVISTRFRDWFEDFLGLIREAVGSAKFERWHRNWLEVEEPDPGLAASTYAIHMLPLVYDYDHNSPLSRAPVATALLRRPGNLEKQACDIMAGNPVDHADLHPLQLLATLHHQWLNDGQLVPKCSATLALLVSLASKHRHMLRQMVVPLN